MSAQIFSLPLSSHNLQSLAEGLTPSRKHDRSHLLWYGGVAVGVLAGAAVSTILWRRRLRALQAAVSPLERAEELIANCERKLETIEQSVADLKDLQADFKTDAHSLNGSAASAPQQPRAS